MAPTLRQRSSRTTVSGVQTPSRSTSPGTDVAEGLVERVNGAFRHRPPSQAQDHAVKQHLQSKSKSTSIQAETGLQPQDDIIPASKYDIPDDPEDDDIRPQPVKRRGRPPKASKVASTSTPVPVNTAPAPEKQRKGGSGNLEVEADGADEDLSDSIEGLDIDSEDSGAESDKETFEHDVDVFNARKTEHNGEELFADLIHDDVRAIHLDSQPLKELCKLLRSKTWAGLEKGEQWGDFNYEDAETKPAQALLPLLAKLQRLYEAAPKAPHLEEQNQFLSKHRSMLGYYHNNIQIVVDHICHQRLHIMEGDEEINKRTRMASDLISYIIPMLGQVLAFAWRLGGEETGQHSFTSVVFELLRQALSWIRALHLCLIEELVRYPLKEQDRHRRNERRKKLGDLLDDLHEIITAAPDQLVKAEKRMKKELQRRQQDLIREKQLKIDHEAAEEERQVKVAERKMRFLLSLHDIHYPLESSAPSSSQSPPPPPTSRSDGWSIEEQRLLFSRIQELYPVCPDLENLSIELDKSLSQTVAMTKTILKKMLAKVLVNCSPEEQAAKLDEIMRNYRAAR
ncbi:hypothetical protein F4777DRAFT_115803 [Nemania sp. FL0916]|nr:hypothetical protein F4777DRAFT_115803 [Nemania sp. FL0916]